MLTGKRVQRLESVYAQASKRSCNLPVCNTLHLCVSKLLGKLKNWMIPKKNYTTILV